MSLAAGPDGMVGGQALDLESEDKQISMSTLRRMHMGKTGALFRAAIRSGAILGGASAVELSALTEYADNFGLAFQIADDILDVTGDEAVIEKPVGSDEKNHKSTYVTLTSLEEASAGTGDCGGRRKDLGSVWPWKLISSANWSAIWLIAINDGECLYVSITGKN